MKYVFNQQFDLVDSVKVELYDSEEKVRLIDMKYCTTECTWNCECEIEASRYKYVVNDLIRLNDPLANRYIYDEKWEIWSVPETNIENRPYLSAYNISNSMIKCVNIGEKKRQYLYVHPFDVYVSIGICKVKGLHSLTYMCFEPNGLLCMIEESSMGQFEPDEADYEVVFRSRIGQCKNIEGIWTFQVFLAGKRIIDAAPSNIYTALENFCSLYGVKYDKTNMGTILSKIDKVDSYYRDVLNSDKTSKMLKELGANTDIQKKCFSKSWTFLRLGMGFDEELTAGILGNWLVESRFSETNREDESSKKAFLDDSQTYRYALDDDWGFGLMQWTDIERKTNFLSMATEMQSGVGNVNVQFALFKWEITSGGYETGQWKKVIDEFDEKELVGNSEEEKDRYRMRKYAVRFLYHVERAGAKDNVAAQNARADIAEIIYEGMK